MSRPLKKHMTEFTELLHGNLIDYTIEYRVHATRRMFQRHIGAEENVDEQKLVIITT